MTHPAVVLARAVMRAVRTRPAVRAPAVAAVVRPVRFARVGEAVVKRVAVW